MAKHHEMWHENMTAYLAFIKGKTSLPKEKRSSRRKESSAKWFETSSFGAAIKLANDGWPEGATRIQQVSDKLTAVIAPMVKKRRRKYDMFGDWVDVPRYIDNDPECMVRNVRLPTTGTKVIRMVVNFVASSGVSTSLITRRGAAIAAIIDTMEQAGYRVELDVVSVVESTGPGPEETMASGVRIKDANQPVEIDMLAFTLSHPSMLRRLGFSHDECQTAELRRKFNLFRGGGYGCCAELTTAQQEAIGCDIYVPAEYDLCSDEDAVAWALEVVTGCGVEMESA